MTRDSSRSAAGGSAAKATPERLLSSEAAKRIREHARATLSIREREATNLYLDARVLPKGTVLRPGSRRIVFDQPGVLVFADDEPRANFAHACRYFVYDESGNPLRRYRAEFAPERLVGSATWEAFHEPVATKPGKLSLPPWSAAAAQQSADAASINVRPVAVMKSGASGNVNVSTARRYAILFAGTPDWHHLNTLELCYRTLIDEFGFDAANIFALVDSGERDPDAGPFADGLGNLRTWPGDNTDFRIQVTGAGTAAELRKVYRKLARGPQQLGPDDLLFIYTEGHGGFDNVKDEAFIATHRRSETDSTRYLASSFAADLAAIGRSHRALLVLMGQCCSGGLAQKIADKSKARATAVACAAREDASSHWSADHNWNHFTLSWLEAQRQRDLAGGALVRGPSVDEDAGVSAFGAWKYADARAPLALDSPVYVTSPPGTGKIPSIADSITLAQPARVAKVVAAADGREMKPRMAKVAAEALKARASKSAAGRRSAGATRRRR